MATYNTDSTFPATDDKQRHGRRGPKVPILPIPQASNPNDRQIRNQNALGLNDLRVKNHTDFYEQNSNMSRENGISNAGLGLPQPNNYLVKKKSNPKFGSTSNKPKKNKSRNKKKRQSNGGAKNRK
jgi:hypothetical protein